MYKVGVLALTALIFTGCSGIFGTERGNYAWCNQRYLYKDNIKKPVADPVHLEFANRGYMYALAATLVLQEADAKDYHFEQPSNLTLIKDDLPRGSYGFDVKSYDRYDPYHNREEVIIAFVGSNDISDWIFTNFLFFQKQHALAREYVKRIEKMRPGKRIVVTGYSLGGALATNVTKHEDTRDLISEAWVFNTSPKTWVSGETDPRIWLGAARGEVLTFTRSPYLRWLPGVNNIGAPPDQTAEDFYLINTSQVYGHFRWVLARNMLHLADYEKAPQNRPILTEPLEILRSSSFKVCKESFD